MQDTSTQFEIIPFTVAALGVTSGILALIPLRGEVWEHLMQHPAFKVSTKTSKVT